MAKFCGNCGNKLTDTDKSCSKCGAIVVEKNKNSNVKSSNVTNNSSSSSNNLQSGKTNGLAVAGFILSIISLLCCGTTAFLGFIFSIIGLVEANKNNQEGKGLAIAGIIISSISVIVLIIFISIGALAGIYDSVSTF